MACVLRRIGVKLTIMAKIPAESPATAVKERNTEKRKRNRLNAYILLHEEEYKPENRKKDIDLRQLSELAGIGCTYEEIAGVLGCSTEYIEDQLNQNPAFAMAFHEGKASMKTSLRRTQIQLAQSGNAAMCIWLGKQHLNQSDKQHIETKTEINVLVKNAMDELNNIPKHQLLEARNVLRGLTTLPKSDVVEAEFSEIDPPDPPV